VAGRLKLATTRRPLRETTTKGGQPDPVTDGLLARNAESENFGHQSIFDQGVSSIGRVAPMTW
jgi:hypothetical protein